MFAAIVMFLLVEHEVKECHDFLYDDFNYFRD